MVGNWQSMLDALRAWLLRRGRRREDADDLVQEAWLRYAVYQRDKPVESPGAFLARTVQNLAISADRARSVRGEEVDVADVSLLDPAADLEATVLSRERLARLAERTQLLVVTHSPQVAARGAAHFFIAKSSDGTVTRTGVHALDETERREEIARMLAGDTITEEARAAALALMA